MESLRPSDTINPAVLVTTFNALPRIPLTPSKAVPNHWHISLRHVPLQPPGDVLFLINPGSRYIFTAGPLPNELQSASIPVKAAAWALLLLKTFIGGLGGGPGEIGRPWSWVCNDAEMAAAVGEKVREMGVVAPEGMGVAGEDENAIADKGWERLFGGLKEQIGAEEGT